MQGGKKKGLSFEQKRQRMLQFFHESKDIFQLKDVEKFSIKKGIIPQAVKEVLDSLLGDDLVVSEKIGNCRYFWSLPSQAFIEIKKKVDSQETKNNIVQIKKKQLEEQLEGQLNDKLESDERTVKLQELEESNKRVQNLESQICQYMEYSEERLNILSEQQIQKKSELNELAEQMQIFYSFLKKQNPMFDMKILEQQFEIKEEMMEEI